MVHSRSQEYLETTLSELLRLPKETEWVEFKHNNDNPQEIGEYISALSNSAALLGKTHGYLVWGINNHSHDVIGTTVNPRTAKVGQTELETWLLQMLKPKVSFFFHELHREGERVVIMEIGAAFRHPVQFQHTEYIRVGSYKKKLKDFPEKERELWRVFDQTPFEREIALEKATGDEVIKLLDYPAYFDLLDLPLPEGREGILNTLEQDGMLEHSPGDCWNITCLGAVLFARRLADFHMLKRKAIRVVVYKGKGRVATIREQECAKGYACGFTGLIEFILNLLPSNEVIGQALRKQVPMFPELAIRELVANAIIHQDFHLTGTAPMVEIFDDRMEITNPGRPLVSTDRFLDSPPRSRNESIASFMRRIGVCEERGSGIDKVVFQTEYYQLPAPVFESLEEHTRCVLFGHKTLTDMDKHERVHACYLHACLRYVQRESANNTSVRDRFGIEVKNSAKASEILKDTVDAGRIRLVDESVGTRARKYVPFWA
jgi:ATP-dependent DNA helicase RecG